MITSLIEIVLPYNCLLLACYQHLRIFTFRYQEDFEILHGDLLGLPDTASFLKSLVELDAVDDSGKTTEKHRMRERKAAAALFNWQVFFILA